MVNALSENTKTAYKNAIQTFLASGFSFPATSSDVAAYIHDSSLALNTLGQHLAALSFVHRAMRVADPTNDIEVEVAMKALRKLVGEDVSRRAKPLLQQDIIQILSLLRYQQQPSLIDLRDATLLLIGFTGAFRRSELCDLHMDDLEFTAEGVILTLRRSKHKNFSFKKAISYGTSNICPVRTLKHWLEEAGIVDGYVFRSMKHGVLNGKLDGEAISDRLKKLCELADIPVETSDRPVLRISGHSLRAGFVTECRKRKIPDWVIMKMTGHQNAQNLTIYTREIDLFDNNASSNLWDLS